MLWGYNSDYITKSYEYDKTKQQEMGRKLHLENLREWENFGQIKGKSMDWIYLVQDVVQLWVTVNIITKT